MDISEKIHHFVVLMLENRSFDNLLGALPHVDGIPKNWKLPLGPTFDGPSLPHFRALDDVRGHGPKHTHFSTLRHLFGPSVNWEAEFGDEPWQEISRRWEELEEDPKRRNRGFLWDYRKYGGAKKEKKYTRLMGTWDRRYIPAIWKLAEEYGVCQRWFSSVPGMTQPNRLFSVCGQSFGYVDHRKTTPRKAPEKSSIFFRLTEADIDWMFYFGGPGAVFDFELTSHIVRDIPADRKARIEDFVAAAKDGDLPPFSYIEPRNLKRGQTMHPGHGDDGADVLERGDGLVGTIYNALRSHEDSWKHTLLVVTWDEHGGFPDHVPPPRDEKYMLQEEDKKKWKEKVKGGQHGFDFSLLGCRVPALVISPWVKKGALDEVEREHTTILRTARTLYGFDKEFSSREKQASCLSAMLEDQPRRLSDCPKKVGVKPPREPSSLEAAWEQPLGDYDRDILSAILDTAREEGVFVGPVTEAALREWTLEDLEELGKRLRAIRRPKAKAI